MAKINIDFDNTNYPIDDSAIASATAQLQSHLSTVMNGTGATITVGGTTYNVDSSKLSAATTAFVSHLGTVSGSGMKVMVNGVEYGVDSTKMGGAIADLHEVLGGLQSGGNGGSEGYGEVILPETTYDEFTLDDMYGLYCYHINPAPFAITLDETYCVVWDGIEYECVAQDMSAMQQGSLALGNLSGMGGIGNNEPFIIGCTTEGGTSLSGVSYVAFDTKTSHTVAIYKVVNGSTDSELNEYGFYFDKVYSSTTTEEDTGDVFKTTQVFHEDGSCANAFYTNGEETFSNTASAGTYTYGDHVILQDGEEYFTVNEDGTELTGVYNSDNPVFTLESNS